MPPNFLCIGSLLELVDLDILIPYESSWGKNRYTPQIIFYIFYFLNFFSLSSYDQEKIHFSMASYRFSPQNQIQAAAKI